MEDANQNSVTSESSKSPKPKTRTTTSCPVFGTATELPESMLPTNADVVIYYLCVRYYMKEKPSSKEPPLSEVAERVSKKVEGVWQKLSIPHVIL